MKIINDNNICAVTEVNDVSFPKSRLSIISFLTYNKWFDGKIYVLLTTEGISENNKNSLKSITDHVRFIQTGETDIRNIRKFAFWVNSPSVVYFSKDSLFQRDISSGLSEHGISSIERNHVSMEYNRDIDSIFDSNIMIISHNVDRDTIKDALKNGLGPDPNGLINKAVRDAGIKVSCDFIGLNASLVKNKDYPNFVRYSKSISYVSYENTNHSEYSRINLYWIGLNKKMKNPSPSNITPSSYSKSISTIKKSEISKTMKPNHRISLCTICNDEFIPGLLVMLESFVSNNEWFSGDIIILYESTYSNISKSNMNLIKSRFKNIVLREINKSDYLDLIHNYLKRSKGRPGATRLVPSLFTFEIFELADGYDTLLYLDSDMLVRGNLYELFNLNEEIIVTPDAGKWEPNRKYSTFNGGFMVLNSTGNTKRYKYDLIKHGINMKSASLADQTIMNSYFDKRVLRFISSRYNCLKRCFNNYGFSKFDKSIKIIHYVGAKPWHTNKSKMELNYTKIESMWHDVYNNLDYSKTLNIVTSSYSDLNFKDIKGKIITTNWGIDLGMPNIDYYVCSTLDDNLIKSINRSNSNIKNWLITNNLKSKLQSVEYYIDLFEYMRNLGNLGEMHMKSKESRGNLDLPTSGVQLIYISSYMDISELNIYGINLYTIKDKSGNYKKIGTTMNENPYTMNSKPHSIKTDIEFIVDSFKRLLNNGVKIKSDSKILNDILNFVKKGMSSSKIINKIHE
jgi:hypothetical protein